MHEIGDLKKKTWLGDTSRVLSSFVELMLKEFVVRGERA